MLRSIVTKSANGTFGDKIKGRYVVWGRAPRGACDVVNNRLTGAQLRAARGLLAISANELAIEAGLSLRTIRRVEKHHGPVQVKDDTEQKIVSVLESRGAIFLERDAAGEGVRLRVRPKPIFGSTQGKSERD